VKKGEAGELGPYSVRSLNATTITRAREPTLPESFAFGVDTSISCLKSESSRWT
jgi:hypothetical protein